MESYGGDVNLSLAAYNAGAGAVARSAGIPRFGETLTTGELGLAADAVGEAGSMTEVLALTDPPPRGESRKIEDDGNAAQQIVDFLVEKKLL